MAAGDPTDPTVVATQASIDQQNAFNTSVDGTTQALNNGVPALNNYTQNGLQRMTTATGYAAAGLLSVSQAAQKFAIGVDAGKISTFSGQLDNIGKAATRPGMALETLQKAGGGLLKMIERMGGGSATTSVTLSTLSAALEAGGAGAAAAVKGIADYAKNVVALADEMKVARMGILQQAAASGTLDAVLHRAGRNMQDFNAIVQKQQQMWVNAQKATGLAQDEIARYSAQLNKVPGVLETITSELHGGNKANQLFTDSLKLSLISGRDYEAITKDMTDAIKNMGTTQRGALDYTTRMSVVAKELKIPIEDLHAAITSSASAFKMFTTEGKAGDEMAKNLEATMGGYIKTLRESHIPMGNAIEMAQHFSGAMNEMGLSQKAFLSQMTGGPGGLMGAFQIEKMMDEGKIDQVFGKVQTALRKQFGRIVTTEEATKSQAAAEAMTRQVMILKQGPLGSFAKTDAEARHLIDSMAKGKKPEEAIKELQKDAPLERFMQAGNKIAQGSQGILNEIATTLAGAEYTTAAGAAKVVEPTLGAKTYFRTGEGTGSPEAMERRRMAGAAGARPGGSTLLETTMKDLKNLPTGLKDTMTALGAALKTGNKESVESANAKLQQSIASFKAQAAALPEDQKKQAMNSIRAITAASTSAMNDFQSGVPAVPPPDTSKGSPTVPPPGGKGGGTADDLADPANAVKKSPLTRDQKNKMVVDYMHKHPGVSRSDAIATLNSPTKDPRETGGTTAGGGQGLPFNQGGRPMAVTLAPGSTIAVNFVGVCPHCKSAINSTEIGKTTGTPAAMHR